MRTMRRLSAEERGFALVMALVILLSLSIALAGVMEMVAASPRTNSRASAGDKAFRLAEAGINSAVAVISACGLFCDGRVGGPPGRAGDPAATNQAIGGGAVSWGGTLGADKTWSLKSIGTMKNPTGPAAANVSRTVTAKLQLNPPQFTFVSLNPSCDNHT